MKIGYAYLGGSGVGTFMTAALSVCNESGWKGYFKKWGEVPRSILERTDSSYQEKSDSNCRAVDIDLCMKWAGTNHYNTTNVSGTVLHMTVTPEGKYEDFQVKFGPHISKI